MNLLEQNRQQRQQMIQKDSQAVQQARQNLPNQNTIDKLDNDLDTIKQEMAPKSEQIREIKTPEPEIDYREQAIENFRNQVFEQNIQPENVKEEPTRPDVSELIPTTDNQPVSEIIPRTDLTSIQIAKARQAMTEAVNQLSTETEAIQNQSLTPEITIDDHSAQIRLPEANDDLTFSSNYPEGYQFAPGNSGLGGQCAWYAQQITTMPGGSNWTIGSTIQEKKNQLAGHIKNGNAFALGEGVPQVGNSIVFNGGKWGHVAVISKINPDGTAILDESNYGNDRTVTKSRTVKLNDPSILGFLKTIPR